MTNLGPATDFYKKLALECSAQQVAVDLFMLNGQYTDIATICKFHIKKLMLLHENNLKMIFLARQ